MAFINKPKKKPNYKKHTKTPYNNLWTILRNSYLMEHPLCERCLLDGKIVAAEEVHHIKPILEGKDELEQKELMLNSNNLMSLCKDCHHKIHNAMRKK